MGRRAEPPGCGGLSIRERLGRCCSRVPKRLARSPRARTMALPAHTAVSTARRCGATASGAGQPLPTPDAPTGSSASPGRSPDRYCVRRGGAAQPFLPPTVGAIGPGRTISELHRSNHYRAGCSHREPTWCSGLRRKPRRVLRSSCKSQAAVRYEVCLAGDGARPNRRRSADGSWVVSKRERGERRVLRPSVSCGGARSVRGRTGDPSGESRRRARRPFVRRVGDGRHVPLETELATWLCALGNLPSTRDLWVFELSAGQVGQTVRLVNELAANALDPALHVCAVAPAVPSADAMAISVVSADPPHLVRRDIGCSHAGGLVFREGDLRRASVPTMTHSMSGRARWSAPDRMHLGETA
jgi:hypothetical protein